MSDKKWFLWTQDKKPFILKTFVLICLLTTTVVVYAATADVRPNATAAEGGGSCTTANAHTTLDDDVESPSGDLCSADTDLAAHDIRLNFATPSVTPNTVVNAQTFKVRAINSKTSANQNAQVALSIYCNGSLVSAGSNQTLSDTLTTYSRTWTFNSVSCASDGSDVEILVDCTAVDAGGTNNDTSCTYDAVEWVAVSTDKPTLTTTAATNVSSTTATFNGNISNTGGQTGSGTNHGFAWGTNSGLSGGDTATTSLGNYAGTGAFSSNRTSLSPNTTYYFRAFAANAGGTTTASILSTTTKPGIPGTPTFSDVTATTLSLDWTAPSGGATSYKIERCAGAACSDWTQIASGVTDLFYDDSGLSANTLYRYRIRATATSGDGNYSAIAQQLTLPATPGTPTFSGVTYEAITVNWTAPSGGADSYIVERCTGAACSDFSTIQSGVAALFYDDSGLTEETHYRYRITATNATGNGSVSGVAGTTTPSATSLSTVTTNAADDITGTSATLNGNITNTGNLTITRRGFAYSTNSALASGVSTTSNTGSFGTGVFDEGISSLTPGTTYYFRAYAENSNGTSTGSILSFSTPDRPTVTTAAATNVSSSSIRFNGEITATGGENATVRGFAYSTTSATLASSTATTTNTGSFGAGTFNQTLSSLLPNTRYYFRAYAENSAGTSTGAILSTTTKPGVPGTPTFEDVTPTTLTINWTAPSGGASSYKIERCSGAGCSNWTEIDAGVTEVTYDDSGLSANTLYRYRVRAMGASGDGDYSGIGQQLTLPATPGTPTFSDVLDTTLTVNWTAPSGGAASYIIERCSGAACSNFSTIDSGVTDLFYDDSGLSFETHYRYRITATNATGNSSVSGVAGTTTLAELSVPTVETDAATSVTGTTATLNGEVTDTGNLTITRRGFAYSTNSALASGVSTTSNTGSFGTGVFDEGISSLTPGTTYYFRAYAENSNGTSTGSILSFATPAAPSVTTNAATSLTNTSMTLNGNVSATGGANATVRGFAYSSTSATLASGVSTTTENGSFGTGAFSTGLTSLIPNTTYYFRAYATNLVGTTNGSILSTTTFPSAPGTPTFANISTTTLTVNWSEPSGGADSYKLERCQGGGCSNWTELDSGIEDPTYNDSDLTANTFYRYRVRASGASGDSSYSGIGQTYTAVDPAAANPHVRIEGGVRFRGGRLY